MEHPVHLTFLIRRSALAVTTFSILTGEVKILITMTVNTTSTVNSVIFGRFLRACEYLQKLTYLNLQ